MQKSIFTPDNSNLIPFQGETKLVQDFFSKKPADYYFQKLQKSLDWKQEPIRMFGKMVMQPRLTALYGDAGRPYGYSGISMNPSVWTTELLEIKEKLQVFSGIVFTHVLCNYYRDGQDSMGWHRDNEAVLGKNPSIASITFGSTRLFQIRHYETKNHKIDIPLTHGSLLMMSGESQHHWEHQLPKTKKVLEPRINLTFRKLL
ncbi:Alkylated DNA repair dioxygenase AlkB [Algoriphagus alkaliphilus]|uniref:Alkylated DNA repair dioxygenase AlkB n=1 Tax=Algoriphagus alkaliphilus TaxID=279824 RepID=A0A1G5VBN0_9BACT|nr:alpha-ketoglutarate-dependent dioxygenase AlkB [Algoriphagus alkaliphilus]MBA4299311.1 alpha-ketoglutarate-dependent dioxygenase AlkB [Cyclobacterium sp.]SDA42816.1 Alkylated DNA repair dioxygenase AlkB [Algoriphagus alkaliphilus]